MAKNVGKPVLMALMSEDDRCREARRILQSGDIPALSNPVQAVSTFIHLHSYTRNLELLYQTPQEIPDPKINLRFIKSIIRRAFCEGRAVLSLVESIKFLEEYKIPVVKTLIAINPQEAEKYSSELGYLWL